MVAPLRLAGVEPERLFEVWPRVSAWVEAACARPGCDLRPVELFVAAANREAQLIVGLDEVGEIIAAAVTQVREYPDRRTCWVLVVGGAWANWRSALSAVEAGARRSGCSAVEFVGRRGWRRVLPGYAAASCEAGTHFSKSLEAA